MYETDRIANIIKPIAEKYDVERISLFGSRARGAATETSDYDFLISKGNLNSLLLYIAFVNDLETALGSHVDVVTDTSSDKSFLDSIKKEGVLLYARQR